MVVSTEEAETAKVEVSVKVTAPVSETDTIELEKPQLYAIADISGQVKVTQSGLFAALTILSV